MEKIRTELMKHIRDIADFPKEGILFRDITPLLSNSEALDMAIEAISRPYLDHKIDYVAAVEARGFIFGSAVARALNAGFIPIRKPGKLPHKTTSVTYDLEYGTDTVEIHTDAIEKGSTILMVDDLLATGGTMAAACELVEKLGGQIHALTFLIELTSLPGREKIGHYPIHSVISY
jgi:adenine phosphoribosyltransferase